MKRTRREFIKQSAGAISISFLMPRVILSGSREIQPLNENRRILVLVQLNGGNDGLNSVIPYTNARYHQLRPNIGFREEELKDDAGNSTVINSQFGFHPSLKELKDFYSQGKLAIVEGVGYPNGSLSHETSTRIWQTGNTDRGIGLGWIGRYGDLALDKDANLPAVAIGAFSPPRVIASEKVRIPLMAALGGTAIADSFGLWRNNLINVFRDINSRALPPDTVIGSVAEIGAAAEKNSSLLESVLDQYQSSVIYPEDNPGAQALKSVAILASIFPETNVFHVSYPTFFDTHAGQIGTSQDRFSKRVGIHARELGYLSQAVKAFYDDMTEHGLGDNFVLATYSEFGRRPNENASKGTDHGTASNAFVIGGKVKGGDIYGQPPSLGATDLDDEGNMGFTTDFRSVYATLIDRWLEGANSSEILGARFPQLGFL